jgi:hypothetical protein
VSLVAPIAPPTAMTERARAAAIASMWLRYMLQAKQPSLRQA